MGNRYLLELSSHYIDSLDYTRSYDMSKTNVLRFALVCVCIGMASAGFVWGHDAAENLNTWYIMIPGFVFLIVGIVAAIISGRMEGTIE